MHYGTQFACFTGTKVQVLTRLSGSACSRTQRFYGVIAIKVQILTKLHLLSWYKRTQRFYGVIAARGKRLVQVLKLLPVLVQKYNH